MNLIFYSDVLATDMFKSELFVISPQYDRWQFAGRAGHIRS